MDFFGINGWEFIVLAILAVLLLGDRMPEYAAKLARFIRSARTMAEGAKDQLREQLGPEYDDIDWRQYDPRQYDPRRIVREAFLEPMEEVSRDVTDVFTGSTSSDVIDPGPADAMGAATPAPDVYDPSRPTPYDVDAT